MAMVDFFRRASSRQGAPRDVDPVLDLAFYKRFYPDLAGHSDDAAALHWRQHGRRENRFPSAPAAVLSHANYPRLPEDFDPADYVYSNRDLPDTYHDAFAATMHFLVFGLGEARQYRAFKTDDAFLAFAAGARRREPTALERADPRLPWQPRGLAQFLYFEGFPDIDFLADFDPDFYFFTGGAAGTAVDRSLHACAVHFGESGADALRPINEKLVFDPFFYRKLVRASFGQGLAHATDASLYRQWLSKRDYRTLPANHRQKLQDCFGVSNATAGQLDLAAYRFANEDLRALDDETLIEQMLSDGLLEQRSFIKIDRSNVMLFAHYADHLQQQGRLVEAERVYHRLIHFVPDAPGLNQRLGDFLVRRERFAEAYQCYRRNIERGHASKWAYLNAATCSDRLSDLKSALLTLDAGCRAYPDDQNIVRQRRSYAERFFADEFAYAKAVASAGRIGDAQARLATAAWRCDVSPDSEAPPRPVRSVALFANMDLAQCTLYRVEQKAEQLAAAGFAVPPFNWSSARAAFERSMAGFDLVLLYRVAAFPGILRLINGARAAGLVTVYEIDDLIFDGHEFPEPYADYAGQITPAEYVDVCMGVPLFRYAMGACDYAIASTPALATRMEPLVRRKRAFVHRNALGLRHERAAAAHSVPARGTGPVTIFYGSGTKAHKGDFETILLPALEEVDRRFEDGVRFVFAGHRPVNATSALLAKARFVPFTANVDDYWTTLAEADINLSVLRRTPATDAKSEIKWLEAAMFAIPSVVSDTQTFAEVIEHGTDGLLAPTGAAFVEHISALVRDPARRAAMGAAARAKALREYGLNALAANIGDVLHALAPPPADDARLRVLVVNVFYPPQTKGGATRVVVDNVAALRELFPDDVEFEVFTPLEGGEHPYAVHVSAHEGIRVTAMTASDDPDVDRVAVDARAGELFRQCVERFEPHLIHFHCIQRITAAATEVALLAKVPYLITAHDAWWISDRQFLYDDDGPAPWYEFNRPARYRTGLEQAARDRPLKLVSSLRGAEAILAVSEPFAAVYRRTGLTNVRAVPNGTPVRIVAKRPQSEVNALYDEIDVLFAPSLWPESYGLVTREAIAAGCWVVASDRGAVGEPVIENVNGHVVPVDTIDALVEVIARIDAEPARYKTRPPAPPPQRTSRDQARDLAAIYRGIARPAPRRAQAAAPMDAAACAAAPSAAEEPLDQG